MQFKKAIGTINKIALVLFCLLNITSAIAQESKYYSINNDGSLNFKPDEKGNIIPDFSRVGYHMGDKELPEVKVVKTISAVENGSSQEVIQKAIDEIAAMNPDKNGFKGAILLKKGTYNIPGAIIIKTSGIVLRGEGND